MLATKFDRLSGKSKLQYDERLRLKTRMKNKSMGTAPTQALEDKGPGTLDHLPVHQLELLQLVSLAFLPITRAHLLQALETAGCMDAQGLPYTLASLNAMVDTLVGTGNLVVQGSKISIPNPKGETVARLLQPGERRDALTGAIRTTFKLADYRYGYFVRQYSEGIRDLRLALYSGNLENFMPLAQTLQRYFATEWRTKNPYLFIFDDPFEPEQFDTLPSEIGLTVAATLVALRVSRLESCQAPLAWLREKAKTARDEQRAWFATVLCEPMIARGLLDDAVALARGKNNRTANAIAALSAVLRGHLQEALEMYAQVIEDAKKPLDLRKAGLAGFGGAGYVIALIASRDPKNLEKASQHIAAVMKAGSSLISIYAVLGHVARATQTVQGLSYDDSFGVAPDPEKDPLGTLFRALACWWVDGAGDRIDQEQLRELAARSEAQGYRWVAAEALELLGRMDFPASAERAEKLHFQMGTQTLADSIRRQPMWERALAALDRIGNDFSNSNPTPRNTRLVWLVSTEADTGRYLLEVREQKRTGRNPWTAGRAIAISRLMSAQHDLEGLTEQDRQVISACRLARTDRKGSDKRIDCPEALLALVGHPLVFWTHELQRPLSVAHGQPVISVTRERNQLRLEVHPSPDEGERIVIHRDSRHRISVTEFNLEQERVLQVLGTEGMILPLAAEERVKELLSNLSLRFATRSEIGNGNVEIKEASAQIYALLSPAPTGLQLELVVQPEGDGGLSWTPGDLPEYVPVQDSSGETLSSLKRHLKQERLAADEIFQHCRPWLTVSEGQFHGVSLNPAAACELLETLKALGDQVRLRWPQGETLKIRGRAEADQLSLQVTSKGEWFDVTGQVEVDKDTLVELKTLLETANTPNTRFVALRDGQYLALSQQLLKRVRDLGSLSEQTASSLKIHSLAAEQLNAVMNEELHSNHGLKTILEKRENLSSWVPDVPTTLKAELRDYQKVGFEWLVRHAHSGAGACLADDMGLGKTLQTLTLLLHRAELGPSLVVAPTSVCGNWELETARFAPSLKTRWLGTSGKDRSFSNAGPGDLIIMSYTLFQQEAKNLGSVEWSTVVLDEAQAIKNAGTKRSQAAMKLNAQFRLITTGTPIENHLGELWNLFRFINPGLLGSLDSFTERFAIPIERHNDHEARERLHRLIQPFVLRRTKSQVLSELPPRTEVTLTLDLSSDERAMYEAVRQEALQSVALEEGEVQPNRIKVLAGIMKLRRACCHGSLVLPEREFTSAKVLALMEILDELHESGHRALIFSQFVGFLEIMRAELDRLGRSYQYLDGSTTASERIRRVSAFQEGEGELFLISLKAGGSGLNLTGADYVIHMDPWWNPAVEDQASDRAHRIGQTRPVTVYRLITRDTIEEKIVALHERKRHLADSLLEGTGEASSISTDELIGLLQEAQHPAASV